MVCAEFPPDSKPGSCVIILSSAMVDVDHATRRTSIGKFKILNPAATPISHFPDMLLADVT